MAIYPQRRENLSNSAEKQFAIEVVQRLRAAGFEALWAGGCVRDLLLEREPTDFDVATSATPEQVREVFGRRRTLPVGMSFGVMIVLCEQRGVGQIEVATFRTDAAYSDGRRPDAVTFSNPREDAHRRDFTINGMFYDPLQGSVIDYVDGQADLQRGLIRAIGRAEDRIAEDKLRMLRAIRFAAKFGFAIEPETRGAIARHAREVALVSGERIAMEIRKTLETNRASWATQEWSDVGLLDVILPELAEQWSENSQATLRLLEAAHDFDWLTRFCALIWPTVGAEPKRVDRAVSSFKGRLKLANDVTDALRFCLTAQARLLNAEHSPWSHIQPLLVSPHAGHAVELLEVRSRIAAADQDLSVARDVKWLWRQLAREPQQLNPPPLLLGTDLIDAGLQPNPQFKELLDQARQLQLDQGLLDRAAALNWLRTEINK